MYVFKLGGSCITKKAEAKFEMNQQLVSEIGDIFAASSSLQFVVICGVGAFGHLNVLNYDLNDGCFSERQMQGVKETQNACGSVAEAIISATGPNSRFVHIPVHELVRQSQKKVVHFDSEPFTRALEKGLVPITTGTMVPDDVLGWSVMSGDAVICELARVLKPGRIFIGTDVAGVFTSDPRKENSKPIPLITRDNYEQILNHSAGESSAPADVTGGMKGKVEKLAAAVMSSSTTCIIFLLTAGSLARILIDRTDPEPPFTQIK